jgi:copper chaperone CopZ
MKTITLELPSLFADHHVIEIRRLLLETAGVEDVYASSAFQVVEITFDPVKVTEEALTSTLKDAGYLGSMNLPAEAGVAGYQHQGVETYFRHTASFEATRKVIGFTQQINYTGRPLWNCPGIGVIKQKMEE